MNKRARILVAIASALLLLLYVFPLWQVSLVAPQYPEGLGLQIRLHTITGAEPYDLQNINGLNHYIGMRPIEPESFPELAYMPWIVGALIAFGIATAALGKRWMAYAWAAALVALAVAGLVDFYRWLYEYGHDLDPTAAIEIPGGRFQPPLIGNKRILNFNVGSWPGLGGWAAILAGILAVIAAIDLFRGRRVHPGEEDARHRRAA